MANFLAKKCVRHRHLTDLRRAGRHRGKVVLARAVVPWDLRLKKATIAHHLAGRVAVRSNQPAWGTLSTCRQRVPLGGASEITRRLFEHFAFQFVAVLRRAEPLVIERAVKRRDIARFRRSTALNC